MNSPAQDAAEHVLRAAVSLAAASLLHFHTVHLRVPPETRVVVAPSDDHRDDEHEAADAPASAAHEDDGEEGVDYELVMDPVWAARFARSWTSIGIRTGTSYGRVRQRGTGSATMATRATRSKRVRRRSNIDNSTNSIAPVATMSDAAALTSSLPIGAVAQARPGGDERSAEPAS